MTQVAICVVAALCVGALLTGAILWVFEAPADQDHGFTDDLGVAILARRSS